MTKTSFPHHKESWNCGCLHRWRRHRLAVLNHDPTRDALIREPIGCLTAAQAETLGFELGPSCAISVGSGSLGFGRSFPFPSCHCTCPLKTAADCLRCSDSALFSKMDFGQALGNPGEGPTCSSAFGFEFFPGGCPCATYLPLPS